jgi:Rrf2 family protein
VKFSTQEEYGLRCLLQLGRRGSLTLAELSQLEGISIPNVAKMMRLMRREGFVQSTRGKDGGYTLARPAEQMVIGELLAALGGRLYDPTFCERHSGVELVCAHDTGCSIRGVWSRVQGAVDAVLGRLTLQDLLCVSPAPAFVSPHALPLPTLSARPGTPS